MGKVPAPYDLDARFELSVQGHNNFFPAKTEHNLRECLSSLKRVSLPLVALLLLPLQLRCICWRGKTRGRRNIVVNRQRAETKRAE